MPKAKAEIASPEPVDYWADDLLGRKAESALLIEFLKARVTERKDRGLNSAYVLNLDAKFGHGKSYFLERFRRDLEEEHVVAFVNAWADDFAEDPLIAIMAGIEEAFKKCKLAKLTNDAQSLFKLSGKVAVVAAKHAALTFGKRVIGDGIGQIVDLIKSEAGGKSSQGDATTFDQIVRQEADAAIDQFSQAKQTIEDFRADLRQLVSNNKIQKPVFVLIDELDRCRPTYAIALLERVKHLFDVADVVFVVATDTEQLRHSVCSVYGQGFDGAGYLLRFFNRTYRFAPVSTVRFLEQQLRTHQIVADALSSPPKLSHAEYLALMSELFGLGLRELERAFDLLRSCVTMWRHKDKVPLELTMLFPLIVLYCRNDLETIAKIQRFDMSEFSRRFSDPSVFLNFEQFSDDRFSRNPPRIVRVALLDLITQFVLRGQKNLPETSNNRTNSQPTSWIQYRYENEFQMVFGRQWHSGREPQTVCLEYTDLIRRVGLLSLTDAQA